MTFATLPMYDFPALSDATNALWRAMAQRLTAQGIEAPATLVRGRNLDAAWADPELLLGQTCGYPLVTSLRGKVRLVATPRYRAEGCDGPSHRSAILVRADDAVQSLADLRGRRCAVNDIASNSGMNLLRASIAPFAPKTQRFFTEIVITFSHAGSIEAVAQGQADVAAIDCVSWAHITHLRPGDTASLRVLAWTASSPGLPLITSRRTDARTRKALRRALQEVAHDPALATVRQALRLEGFDLLSMRDYEAVRQLQRQAKRAGYPTLI